MSKRAREESPAEDLRTAKRARPEKPDRLSVLSDEVLLQILNFLPIPSLITCQRLSRRFQSLAGDSELWKRKYYNRWVRPRARRLQHLRRKGFSTEAIDYSPKVSQWLDHGHLALDAPNTSWKNQYRLKHNWSTGVCRVAEVEVARPPVEPVLVKLENGVVFTADSDNGLRAWSMKDTNAPFMQYSFPDHEEEDLGVPTAISVTPHDGCRDHFEVFVGFEEGTIDLYSFDGPAGKVRHRFRQRRPRAGGAITALASASHYLLSLGQNEEFSLYRIFSGGDEPGKCLAFDKIKTLTCLQASNVQAPLSLSLRTVSGEIVATVAYSFTRIGCGWSVGLQELRLNEQGENVGSRLATTVDSQYSQYPQHPQHPYPYSSYSSGDGLGLAAESRKKLAGHHRCAVRTQHGLDISHTLQAPLSSSNPPTSISYSHPYLVLSHSDNTLLMYLVVSTSDTLAFKAGRRLWGHTSSVAGVHVSSRGKAVSMSGKGDDIRIWELENVVSSVPSSRKALTQDRSIRVSPGGGPRSAPGSLDFGLIPTDDEAKRLAGLGLALDQISDDESMTRMRGLVGFDDEQVVVLCERDAGTQTLGCYDFT